MKRKIINLSVNNEREDKKKIIKDIITESEEVDGCGCCECDTPLLSSPLTKSSSVNFEEIEEKKKRTKIKKPKYS